MIRVQLVSDPFRAYWWYHPIYIGRSVFSLVVMRYLRVGPIIIYVERR